MPISEKNAIKAIKQVGLDPPGPIRWDVKEALIVKAARLAEYYDRMDIAIGQDWDDMTGVADMILMKQKTVTPLPGLPQETSESSSGTDRFAEFLRNLEQSEQSGLIDFSPVLKKPFGLTNKP